MSEDKDLLDRIAKISGQINLHRTHLPYVHSSRSDHNTAESSWNSNVPPDGAAWRSSRVTPYPSQRRARAGRIAPVTHRHRSLVLNNRTGTSAGSTNENVNPNSMEGYITKNDRHMQLINTSIYDRETQQRNKAIEETRRQRALRRDQREKHKIQKHLLTDAPRPGTNLASATVHEITINGLRFHVIDSGSKLARIRGSLDSGSATPKEANVGGVKFLRSKNGNLYRSGIVKAKKTSGPFKKISEPCKRFTATGIPYFPHPSNLHCINLLLYGSSHNAGRAILTPATSFLGQCPKGPRCPYNHDPAKVAMCKDFLQKGVCPAGDSCDLSHDPTPERVPACLHFLRGKCSNPSCRYAHVRVNPSAAVCKDFAAIGYCGKGAECPRRHVHECPDYANTGVCRNQKCHLPHVDRAGQIKKHAANNTGPVTSSAEDEDSDLVSDEDDESDSGDIDSDGMEDMMGLSDGAASHVLSQQQDFVHF